MARGRKHLVIPDTQVKPGVPLDHIKWASNYAIEKKPDAIILIGDWADMSSLSSYDVGTKAFEGRRIKADLEVSNEALAIFMDPILKETQRVANNHKKRWEPEKEFTEGNHENRILRAINLDPKIEGLIHPADLHFRKYGFNVHPFLKPVVKDGVAYCHYFASGVMGRPITTARSLLNKMHMSCFAGHQQGRDIAYSKRADGRRLTGIISGSFYQHNEEYLNPQTNDVWHGIWMLHEVQDGSFDEMPVSLGYLREKYS